MPTKEMGGIVFTETEEDETAVLDWLAGKLGCDRYFFVGYHQGEATKWANSRGAIGDGTIKIGVKFGKTAIASLALALLLTDYDFSDELRREVFDILNQHYTHGVTKGNSERNQNRD